MELFESGNGVRVHLCWSPFSLWSCDLYTSSIDEIRRGYSRPTRNYRLEMELREASHTDFSDLTNGYPAESTFWHIFVKFTFRGFGHG